MLSVTGRNIDKNAQFVAKPYHEEKLLFYYILLRIIFYSIDWAHMAE